MPEKGLTTELGRALQIDFAERFGKNINSLMKLIGSTRTIAMAEGSLIKTKVSSVELHEGEVVPGALIPLSEVKIEDGPSFELKYSKQRKSVPAESIQAYGYERAIIESDNVLLNRVQKQIRNNMFEFLEKGLGKAEGKNLQEVLARNWAEVTNAFEEDDVEVISFVNPSDIAEYLATANIVTQNQFGMYYLEGFMNNKVVFAHGSVEKGKVYSTAAENIVLAYADINRGDISKVFDMISDSTGLVGVTHAEDRQRMTFETISMYGIVLFAERLDGVIIGEINEAEAVPEG